jgi:hypothetical protein
MQAAMALVRRPLVAQRYARYCQSASFDFVEDAKIFGVSPEKVAEFVQEMWKNRYDVAQARYDVAQARNEAAQADKRTELAEVERRAELAELSQLFTEKENCRLLHQILQEQSKYEAIANLRPLLTHAAFQHTPDAKSATIAFKEMAKLLLTADGKKLNRQALEDLRELEQNHQDLGASVYRETMDMYHELSKPFHFVRSVSTGIHCGGTLPLRTACALHFLVLQRQGHVSYALTYSDDKFTPLKMLIDGKIKPVPPKPAENNE